MTADISQFLAHPLPRQRTPHAHNSYAYSDANVEYNSSAEQLPTMTGDPPPVMDKSLVLSSQTATLSRGRGTASSLTLQRSSAAAVAAAAVDAAARATASAASDFNSDQSGVTLGESETKSKVALTSRDPSQGASTDDNANQEVKTVATADISSTAWDVENRYTRDGVDRDYARGGNGSFGGAGGRGGSYSGSYGSGDFDQDSLTSSSSVMTVRPLQPALAMQSNGSTASAVTPRDESPTGGFAAFGGSPTGMSDVVTVQEPRSDTMSEGVEVRKRRLCTRKSDKAACTLIPCISEEVTIMFSYDYYTSTQSSRICFDPCLPSAARSTRVSEHAVKSRV